MMPASLQVRHCRSVIDLLHLHQCICRGSSTVRCRGYLHFVHQATVVILPRPSEIHLEQSRTVSLATLQRYWGR